MTVRERREQKANRKRTSQTRIFTDDNRTFKTPGDFHIIRAATEGDHQPLIDELRKRPDKVSHLAADVIEGKLKRPSHRQKTLTQQIEYVMIVMHFDGLVKTNGGNQKAAKADTAEWFGCHARTVGTAIAEAKKFNQQFNQQVKSMANADGFILLEEAFKVMDEITGAAHTAARRCNKVRT
jgi:hypothetical protein